MANITLAITASISAYKAADIANQLTKEGHSVTVLMTKAATAFITPLTMQALTKNPVYTDVLQEEDPSSIKHIDLAKETDLFLVAPLSASTLAKLANGFADNMMTTVALAIPAGVPKLIAPAMNTNMYLNPATQDNLEKLARYGYTEIAPREALLACGDFGTGALATTDIILEKVREKLNEKH